RDSRCGALPRRPGRTGRGRPQPPGPSIPIESFVTCVSLFVPPVGRCLSVHFRKAQVPFSSSHVSSDCFAIALSVLESPSARLGDKGSSERKPHPAHTATTAPVCCTIHEARTRLP